MQVDCAVALGRQRAPVKPHLSSTTSELTAACHCSWTQDNKRNNINIPQGAGDKKRMYSILLNFIETHGLKYYSHTLTLTLTPRTSQRCARWAATRSRKEAGGRGYPRRCHKEAGDLRLRA